MEDVHGLMRGQIRTCHAFSRPTSTIFQNFSLLYRIQNWLLVELTRVVWWRAVWLRRGVELPRSRQCLQSHPRAHLPAARCFPGHPPWLRDSNTPKKSWRWINMRCGEGRALYWQVRAITRCPQQNKRDVAGLRIFSFSRSATCLTFLLFSGQIWTVFKVSTLELRFYVHGIAWH